MKTSEISETLSSIIRSLSVVLLNEVRQQVMVEIEEALGSKSKKPAPKKAALPKKKAPKGATVVTPSRILDNLILKFMRANRVTGVTSWDAARHLGVSETTTRHTLKRLVQTGCARMNKVGTRFYYFATSA